MIGEKEWLARYRQFFINRGVPARIADEAARAEPFEVLSEGCEDDPEEAADNELSYWTDDEPETL